MERLIFYHYSDTGVLTLEYYDDDKKIQNAYLFYTLRQALKQFRKDYNLQNKKIKILAI